MRGKVEACSSGIHEQRITPAHAGKSVCAPPLRCIRRDHPRACGEKRERRRTGAVGAGSPPRMRGKDKRHDGQNGYQGITPAHAGKSLPAFPDGVCNGDHPRACGEKFCDTVVDCIKLGSPPRMRGKVRSAGQDSGPAGITPAHAGKSNFPVC